MKKFTVIWQHKVLPRLTDIYVTARQQGRDTAAITRAVAQIDSLLETNPGSQGESRSRYERILIVSPLTVKFEVYDDERVALISSVRYRRGR